MENSFTSMKYYRVEAMCGHVGRRHYLAVSFAVKAANAHEATAKVRCFPRVKHDKSEAILSCVEISLKDYKAVRDANFRNPFLQCHSRRDLAAISGLMDSVLPYLDQEKKKRTFATRQERIAYLLHKEKINRLFSEGRYDLC